MRALLFLFCLTIPAWGQAAPRWPAKAALTVERTPPEAQADAKGKATSQVTLRWPAAAEAVGYRVLRNGRRVARLAATARTYTETVAGRPGYQVIPEDAAGARGPALKSKPQRLATLMSLGAGGDNTGAMLGSLAPMEGGLGLTSGGLKVGLGPPGAGQGSHEGIGIGELPKRRRRTPPTRATLDAPTVTGGLSADVVRRVLRRQLNAMRYCIERAGWQGPGEFTLSLVVQHGKPIASQVGGLPEPAPPGAARVGQCLAGRLKRIRFPDVEGATQISSRLIVPARPAPKAPAQQAPAAAP